MNKIFHWLDRWLWRQGVGDPAIRPMVRNEILLTLACLLAGGLLYPLTVWVFWFGAGFAIMALTVFSLARFFLRTGVGPYSTALLTAVLLRWALRMLALGGFLYVALIICKAPVAAILGGLTCAIFTALVTYAMVTAKLRKGL